MSYLKTYLLDIITKHYFDFNGRESRKVFWLFILNMFIINLFLYLVYLDFVSIIILIALFFPFLGLMVRRLHDINFSGWWTLIGCIPLIGIIALIIFGCIPGTEGNNKYGAVNVAEKVE